MTAIIPPDIPILWVFGTQVWHLVATATASPLGGPLDGLSVFDDVHTVCGLWYLSGTVPTAPGQGDVWEGDHPPPPTDEHYGGACQSCLRIAIARRSVNGHIAGSVR